MDLDRISRAFYLGYLWSLGRRFAMDRAMAMDAKRDLRDVRWVTINGTHVPISKKTGKIVGHLKEKIETSKSTMATYRRDKVTEERAQNAYSDALKKLSKANSKSQKVAAVKAMAEALIGFVERKFDGYGYRKVKVDKNFANHCKKFLYDNRNSAKVAADLILFALSKLPDVIENGQAASDWHPDKDPLHHPNYEFLNVYKQFKRNGKNVTVVFDLARKKQSPNSEHRSHNVNLTGIASYEAKRKGLGIAKDSLNEIKVIGVSVR